MISGFYSAVSGGMARMSRLDVISDNLANVGTVGYKRGQSAFEAVLGAAGTGRGVPPISYARLRDGFTDRSQGTLTPTGFPLDLAISGEGFFQVRDPQGELYYTRQGNLRLSPEGELVTAGGLPVLADDGEPIVLSGPEVTVREDGTLESPEGVRRLGLYSFADTAVLERRGNGLLALTAGAATPVAAPRILQGQLEAANVNMMQEMALLVESLRAFEACQKLLLTHDEINGRASELGTIG